MFGNLKAKVAAALLPLVGASCTTSYYGPPANGQYNSGQQTRNSYSPYGNASLPPYQQQQQSYASQRAEYNSLNQAKSRARKMGDWRTEAAIMERQEELRASMQQARYFENQKRRTERTIYGGPSTIVESAARTANSALRTEVNKVIRDAIRGN